MLKFSFSVTLRRAGVYYFKVIIVSPRALPLLPKPPFSLHSVLCANVVPLSSFDFLQTSVWVDRLFEGHMARYCEFDGTFSFPQLEKQI